MPDGDIIFSLDNQRLEIKSSDNKIDFQLKIIDSDKFPELKNVSDDMFFNIPQKEFMEMINHTIFAVSDDETRYFMNGVYLEENEGKLTMVATDGRRLSSVKKDYEFNSESFKGIINSCKNT